MKQFFFFIFISSSLLAQVSISKENLKQHIYYLSSDKLKGRGTSSEEELKAAAYISRFFTKIGLQPKGTKGMMYEFSFKKNPNPHDTNSVNIKERKGYNVVGYLDNKAKYTIVIGAHYDHLGLGHDYNSLDANPENKIHNGADDNASGTAGVLELARYYATNKTKENYNFLFMCFSGEELGLLGSKKWCENPTIPLSSINYMINMDMIGRLNDSTNKLLIYGVGTSPLWTSYLLDSLNINRPAKNERESCWPVTYGMKFNIKKDSSGIGPSDQTSFYLKDIPVLHFFTGQHSDYHKPSDDADKINFEGEKKVLDYIINLIDVTNTKDKLVFTKTKQVDSGKLSFKVTMGIMPDYAYEGKGIRVDGVTNSRPAANAGLLAGDVIIQLGDYVINTMQDYMKALGAFKKGDGTYVTIIRGKEQQVLSVYFD